MSRSYDALDMDTHCKTNRTRLHFALINILVYIQQANFHFSLRIDRSGVSLSLRRFIAADPSDLDSLKDNSKVFSDTTPSATFCSFAYPSSSTFEHVSDTQLIFNQTPYATCGSGPPGAMKLVRGFLVFFAAEHLAMVGELWSSAEIRAIRATKCQTYLRDITSVR